jgi:hypothetical protein
MPILSYFCVAGSALMALLLIAHAALPAREPLKLSSDVYGLPERRPVQAALMLTAREAPAPDMNSEAVKLAAAPPIAEMPVPPPVTGSVAAPPGTATEVAQAKRKRAPRRAREAYDAFAHQPAWGWQTDPWSGGDARRSRRADSRRTDWQTNGRSDWGFNSWSSEHRRAERSPWSFDGDRRRNEHWRF